MGDKRTEAQGDVTEKKLFWKDTRQRIPKENKSSMRRCRCLGELSILRRHLASSHLLGFKVLVKQVEGLLVGT